MAETKTIRHEQNYELVKTEVFRIVQGEEKEGVLAKLKTISEILEKNEDISLARDNIRSLLKMTGCHLTDEILNQAESLGSEDLKKLIQEVRNHFTEMETLQKYFDELHSDKGILRLQNPDPDFRERNVLEVFVPLSLTMQCHKKQDRKSGEDSEKYSVISTPVDFSDMVFHPEKLPQDDKIKDPLRNKFIIQGVVGAGKSTIFRHFIKNNLSKYQESGRIPVFVTAFDFLEKIKEGVDLQALLPEINIGSRQVDFFIDGLDECSSSEDSSAVLKIIQNCKNPHYRFMVTSRFIEATQNDEVQKHFQAVAIDSLKEIDDRRGFIQRYLRGKTGDKPRSKGIEITEEHCQFLEAMLDENHLFSQDITSTPGGLMHICIAFKKRLQTHSGNLEKLKEELKETPWTIATVYADAIDYILGDHEKEKGGDAFPLLREHKAVFYSLAFAAFEGGNISSSNFSEEVFQKGLANYTHGKSVDADELVRQLLLSNVIRKLPDGNYEFIHLSYKEYFLAEYLASQNEEVVECESLIKKDSPYEKYFSEEEKEQLQFLKGERVIFSFRAKNPKEFYSNNFQNVLGFYFAVLKDPQQKMKILQRIDILSLSELKDIALPRFPFGQANNGLDNKLDSFAICVSLAKKGGVSREFFEESIKDRPNLKWHIIRYFIREGGREFYDDVMEIFNDNSVEESNKIDLLYACLKYAGSFFYKFTHDFLAHLFNKKSFDLYDKLLRICLYYGGPEFYEEIHCFLQNDTFPKYGRYDVCVACLEEAFSEFYEDVLFMLELDDLQINKKIRLIDIFIENGKLECVSKVMVNIMDSLNIDSPERIDVINICLRFGITEFYPEAHKILNNFLQKSFSRSINACDIGFINCCLQYGKEEFHDDIRALLNAINQHEVYVEFDHQLFLLEMCLKYKRGAFFSDALTLLNPDDYEDGYKKCKILEVYLQYGGSAFYQYIHNALRNPAFDSKYRVQLLAKCLELGIQEFFQYVDIFIERNGVEAVSLLHRLADIGSFDFYSYSEKLLKKFFEIFEKTDRILDLLKIPAWEILLKKGLIYMYGLIRLCINTPERHRFYQYAHTLISSSFLDFDKKVDLLEICLTVDIQEFYNDFYTLFGSEKSKNSCIFSKVAFLDAWRQCGNANDKYALWQQVKSINVDINYFSSHGIRVPNVEYLAESIKKLQQFLEEDFEKSIEFWITKKLAEGVTQEQIKKNVFDYFEAEMLLGARHLNAKPDTEGRFEQMLQMIHTSFGFTPSEGSRDMIIEHLDSGSGRIFYLKTKDTGAMGIFTMGWKEKDEKTGEEQFYGYLIGVAPELGNLGLAHALMKDVMENRIDECGGTFRGAVNPFGHEAKFCFDFGMDCSEMIRRDDEKTKGVEYFGGIPADRLIMRITKNMYQQKKESESQSESQFVMPEDVTVYEKASVVGDNNSNCVALKMSREIQKFSHLSQERISELGQESECFYKNAQTLFDQGYVMKKLLVEEGSYQYVFVKTA